MEGSSVESIARLLVLRSFAKCWNDVTAVVLTLVMLPLSNKSFGRGLLSRLLDFSPLPLCFPKGYQGNTVYLWSKPFFYDLVWIVQNFHYFNHSLISLSYKQVSAYQVSGSTWAMQCQASVKPQRKRLKIKGPTFGLHLSDASANLFLSQIF